MLSAARSAHCPKIADDDLRAWHSRVLARWLLPLASYIVTHPLCRYNVLVWYLLSMLD
jgi:hypothetical protein